MWSSAAFTVVSMGLLAACSAPATLVVKVESDLVVPSELAQVGVVVRDSNGLAITASDFPLGSAEDIPFSVGVAPLDDDATRTVTIELSALDEELDTLFVRRAVTGFVNGERRLLMMRLASRCVIRAPSCGAGETCTEDGCASEVIDPTSLPAIEPGAEIGETSDR